MFSASRSPNVKLMQINYICVLFFDVADEHRLVRMRRRREAEQQRGGSEACADEYQSWERDNPRPENLVLKMIESMKKKFTGQFDSRVSRPDKDTDTD